MMFPQTTSMQIPHTSTQSLAFCFFDQTIEFKSHSTYLHTTLAHMYHRFKLAGAQNASATTVIEQHPTREQDDTSKHEFSIFEVSRLQRAYTTQIRTHFLIHAGVLSYANQGIMLVAPSMHGKTTLTLKLLHDGFDFLSDDIAPIGLADSLLYPFPRSFVIRSGSVKLAGFSPLSPSTPMWLGKHIVDAEMLRPDCIGHPVPIRHIFFHHDKPESHDQNLTQQCAPQDENISYKILVRSLPDSLKDAIRAISGMEELAADQFDGQIRLHITAKNRLAALQQIDALCEAHDIEVTHLGENPPQRRSFDGPAELTKISNSKAVVNLLDHFLGGYHSALFQNEMNNSPIKLSMTLGRMIQNADCYMLRVGPLEDMATLVKDTVYASVKQSHKS